MNKLLETIMNFINENTTLLIIICVFLIFVLIGYLIDNSIKTKKLEKQMINEEPDMNVNNEEASQIDSNAEINLDFRTDEEKENENKEESVPTIDPNTEINLDFRTDEEKADNNEPISNEVSVDPAINDLLLRDFANNGITTVDTNDKVENDEVSINPIDNIVQIDSIITSDEENKPNVEEPKEEQGLYKNDKKISDIFKKKSTSDKKVNLDSTVDYSNELDKILKKLNDATDSKDSTLEETTDFTNMF